MHLRWASLYSQLYITGFRNSTQFWVASAPGKALTNETWIKSIGWLNMACDKARLIGSSCWLVPRMSVNLSLARSTNFNFRFFTSCLMTFSVSCSERYHQRDSSACLGFRDAALGNSLHPIYRSALERSVITFWLTQWSGFR
jgi:hypothetical protein